MCALADVRGEGGASVNDCKKYGQQFIILGKGDQGSQNHTSSIHMRQKSSYRYVVLVAAGHGTVHPSVSYHIKTTCLPPLVVFLLSTWQVDGFLICICQRGVGGANSKQRRKLRHFDFFFVLGFC
jgi:hypothetical protein